MGKDDKRIEKLVRDASIKKEAARLKKIFKNIPADKLKIVEGVIQRASFMRVTLEDLEKDINEFGTIEKFSQTEDIEYDRERPATRIYNTTIKNYSAAIKQLLDLLPPDDPKPPNDELMDFVKKARI